MLKILWQGLRVGQKRGCKVIAIKISKVGLKYQYKRSDFYPLLVIRIQTSKRGNVPVAFDDEAN